MKEYGKEKNNVKGWGYMVEKLKLVKMEKVIRDVLVVCLAVLVLLILFFNSAVQRLSDTYVKIMVMCFMILVIAAILYAFQMFDEKHKETDCLIYKKRVMELVRAQEIIFFVYLMICAVVIVQAYGVIVDSQGGWIVYEAFVTFPIVTQLTILMNYYYRVNTRRSQYMRLCRLLDQLSEGRLDLSNPFRQEEPYYQYGHTFEVIGQRLRNAIEEATSGEKEKMNMVLSVSNNLIFPLTSVRLNLELMKKEKLEDSTKDYIEMITKEVENIKLMVDSQLKLVRTTYGDLPLNQDTINMNTLIEDILQRIEGQENIRREYTEEDVEFVSDSKCIQGICMNLIDNAIKYSLDGTRIFIKTMIKNGYVYLRILNTSNYEMDFTAESVLARLNLHSDTKLAKGNGVGLIEAKAYTELCGGRFHIRIEGDQFMTYVAFPNIR